ncbi:hypothetical protein CANARDRAFT_23525 [[Candida] arabinofermentans NRRL YB-2248]|uniref:Sulfite efflux pump SSU1 n=1 Tax=[Candida] arabinofermentans NRRL YB-2248 TaxID=983967 RepID=A0A1E4SZM8_9ASCO|nr:hypothetical protein CANARDRAFT_23525 [[Candida] arabinofermentans NRRL YB-2248]
MISQLPIQRSEESLSSSSTQHELPQLGLSLTDASTLSSSNAYTSSKWMAILDLLLVKFHPVYFVIVMGTGITSAVLYNFPIDSIRVGSKYVGIVFFFINLVAFFVIHILFFLRYFCFYKRYDNVSFISLLKNHRLNVFLGAEVMGICTIINMIHYLKPNWRIFTYCLWWINVVLSFLSAWGIAFIMFAINEYKNTDLNATILLPIVTLTVTASTGCIVGSSFMDYPMWQLSTDIVTYMLWGNAIMMSLPLISVYFYKLLVFGIPQKKNIYSSFIPIGIMGQGAYAILLNFSNLGTLIVEHDGLSILGLNHDFSKETLLLVQSMLHLSSISISLFLMSMGFALTVIAILSILKYGIYHKWVKTMWAATFPMGTMSVGFTQIYHITGLLGFKIMGTIYGVMLILITTFCLVNTFLYEFPHRKVFDIIRGNDKTEKQEV